MSTTPNIPNPPAPTPADIERLTKALEAERSEHRETRARLSTLRTSLGKAVGLGDDAPLETVTQHLGDVEKTITDRLAPVVAERDQARQQLDTLAGEMKATKLKAAVSEAVRRAGVRPECIPDAEMHLANAVEVNSAGEVVTKTLPGEIGGQSPEWFMVSRLRVIRPAYWLPSVGGGAKGSAGNNPASAVDDRCFNPRDPVHHSVTAQGKFYVRYGAAAAEAARRKYGGGR